MYFLYALFKRAIMLDSAVFRGKKIALSGMVGIMGLLFLNNAILLLSLSLYNMLIAYDLSPYLAAITSSGFLLVLSLLLFLMAYKIFNAQKPTPELPATLLKNTAESFYAGFMSKE